MTTFTPENWSSRETAEIADQQGRAEGWDVGYASGHSRAMRMMSDEPNVPDAVNPYRDLPQTRMDWRGPDGLVPSEAQPGDTLNGTPVEDLVEFVENPDGSMSIRPRT